jgi:16S rRNA (cytosine967-C5)-methyltransferase
LERLYAEIAEVKEPLTEIILENVFCLGSIKRIPNSWLAPVRRNTWTKKIKGRFDELSKVRALKESIPDWMDELELKN